MLRTVALYGLALAAAAVALQWLEYRFVARAYAAEFYIALIAAGFLGLGVWVGSRLVRVRPAGAFEPNLLAQRSLGITDREYEILRQLAAGRSNKEIAQRLNVSPNTVKTHLARRTEAILRARALGLLP